MQTKMTKIVAMMILMIKVGLQKINENLVNVLQNLQNNVSLSFENVEWMSEEEKIMIKKIIKIAEYDLDEEINGFNLIQDEGWEVAKMPPTIFFPITSTNVGLSPIV